MDYAKKSVKYGKALYTAVDGAIRNPEQFLAHGQHNQQQQAPQQQYHQQQIPQQYNPQQPPPYPPRPGAQPLSPPVYNNGPIHSVSYQQQTTGYTQNPQLPPRPQTVEPYPTTSQPMNPHYQQTNQQFSGHIPAAAPYTQQPTSPPPAWAPNQQHSQPVYSPQQPPQPVFSPVHQPPQPIFSPVQTSQAYSPPPTGVYSPPPTGSFSQAHNQTSPVPPVSPLTTSATPVLQPFSPPLPTSTPAISSPQLGSNAQSFPNNGPIQGHNTPPPLSHTPGFGSHAGHALNPYHPPSANPISAPLSPPASQNPHFLNAYNQPGPSQQTAFIAELPEDNFANQPVELPAELPGDLISSKAAEHNKPAAGLAHAASAHEHTMGTTSGNAAASTQAPSGPGQTGNSSTQPVSMAVETPIIPPSTVTPSEKIQQPTPVHPQTTTVASTHTTPPPTQWQAPASATAYQPSTYTALPGPGQNSPPAHSAQLQQAHSGANTSGYVAYSQPQQPAPYQQPNIGAGNMGYVAYGQPQQPLPPVAYGSPPQSPYGQPAPQERMGSLAQKAQQMTLNSQPNGPSAQFPYRAPGSDDQNHAQGPVQQQSFGLPVGYPQQNQGQQGPPNTNSPGYHPHGPSPPYAQS